MAYSSKSQQLGKSAYLIHRPIHVDEPFQYELFAVEEPRRRLNVRSCDRSRRGYFTPNVVEHSSFKQTFDPIETPLLYYAFQETSVVQLSDFRCAKNTSVCSVAIKNSNIVTLAGRELWPLLDHLLLELFKNGGETRISQTVADCLYIFALRGKFYVGDFVQLTDRQACRIGPEWAIERIQKALTELHPALVQGLRAPSWLPPHQRFKDQKQPIPQLPAHRRWWEQKDWLTQQKTDSEPIVLPEDDLD